MCAQSDSGSYESQVHWDSLTLKKQTTHSLVNIIQTGPSTGLYIECDHYQSEDNENSPD
jgi:hypothetical protein